MDKLTDLRITTISDREVLWWLSDSVDGEGWATSKEIVATVGASLFDHPHPHRLVSNRLGWLMRLGAVDREFLWDEEGRILHTKEGKPRYSQRWRLTDVGLAFMQGSLTKRQEESMRAMSSDKMYAVTYLLAESYAGMQEEERSLVRRALRWGTHAR